MFEEALKWVGPYPLVQLMGSIVLIYLGARTAIAGKKNSEEVSVDLPDWFLNDFKDLQKDIQKIRWVVEDVNNKIEHLRGLANKSITR